MPRETLCARQPLRLPALRAGLLGLSGLLLAGAALSACGGAGADHHAGRPAVAAATAPTPKPRCLPVPQPAPRRAQHIPRPTRPLSADRAYTVTLQTNCGAIQIRLDTLQAPRTTASFAYLVRRGFYNGLTFHNISLGFAIQGGDPKGDGSGGPGYMIVEPPPAAVAYHRGTVAMAKSTNAAPGSSGSQFFILTASQPAIPHVYALIGQVISGYETVQAIDRIPTDPAGDGAPEEPVVIEQATIASAPIGDPAATSGG